MSKNTLQRGTGAYSQRDWLLILPGEGMEDAWEGGS